MMVVLFWWLTCFSRRNECFFIQRPLRNGFMQFSRWLMTLWAERSFWPTNAADGWIWLMLRLPSIRGAWPALSVSKRGKRNNHRFNCEIINLRNWIACGHGAMWDDLTSGDDLTSWLGCIGVQLHLELGSRGRWWLLFQLVQSWNIATLGLFKGTRCLNPFACASQLIYISVDNCISSAPNVPHKITQSVLAMIHLVWSCIEEGN